MPAETAKQFEALEAQASRIMGVFIRAGYEAVAPALIQPADVFLDVIGEALRARTYVFTDPDGAELCLRPDLTVPAARIYLERHPRADAPAKYGYNGPAFRFQPVGADAAQPREFRQAGIEAFGAADRETAEADILAVTIDGLRSAGLKRFGLRLGDLGLFRELLDAADMPDRWRRRLRHLFWRPDAFRAELKRLTTDPAQIVQGVPAELVAQIAGRDAATAEDRIEKYLTANGIDLVGARSASEIAVSLLARIADAKATPLSRDVAAAIESYLAVRAPANAVMPVIAAAARARGKGAEAEAALAAFERRLKNMSERGVDLSEAEFSAEFGRNLEYYTGFVFEIVAPSLGAASPVAGGGRYDNLLRAVGAPRDVPAVGAAIHTERLLATVKGDEA